MSGLQISLSNLGQTIVTQFRVKSRSRRLRKIDSCDPRLLPPRVCNEWDLVQQGIAGDSSVLEQLFNTYTARLYRTAFGVLGNKQDAEDAVQNGLCRAYANLQSFQGRSSFSTWLTRIVINSALMIRRRRNGRTETSLDEILDSQPEGLQYGIVHAGPNPEEICRGTEIDGLVETQVRQLPPGLRAAFQLCDLDGLSATDSIQMLGISMSAFKSRISRARQKVANGLRQSLQTPAGGVSVVGAI